MIHEEVLSQLTGLQGWGCAAADKCAEVFPQWHQNDSRDTDCHAETVPPLTASKEEGRLSQRYKGRMVGSDRSMLQKHVV